MKISKQKGGSVLTGEKVELIKHLYEWFNARNIDAVLAMLTEDVLWANAMDAGMSKVTRVLANIGRASGLSSIRMLRL